MGPINAQVGISVIDRTLRGRGIQRAAFVLKNAVVGQCQEPMGKARGNKQTTAILRTQDGAKMLPVGGRRGAQVNRDIVDRSLNNRYEFGLGMRGR